MTHKSLIEQKSQAGFTLVELAIVMIIIGLLIGGVLKGQELIGNAEIAATASQIEGYDAATTTFRDIYDGMPGDLAAAVVRVPNCGGCANGGGDGFVNTDAPGAAMTANGENEQFWVHLHFADLIGGINPAVAAEIYPDAEVEGNFTMGYHAGGALGQNAGAFRGHYASIVSVPAGAVGGGTITASQAARLDRKLDDGVPNTGSVFADAATCINAGIYDEGNQGAVCDMFFRIQ